MKKITVWLLNLFLAANVAVASNHQQIETKITETYGERAGKRAIAWQHLITKSLNLSAHNKLKAVNDFFNQFLFISDQNLWGTKDYWATPYEFIGVGAGDCEDFSIAKYKALLKLGIDDKKLRLIYVKALQLNQFHMVVAYYSTPSSIPLILDNLNGDILVASKRQDLLPIYSFNGSKLWLMKQKGRGQLAGDASRLSLWNDLRYRSNNIILNQPIKIY